MVERGVGGGTEAGRVHWRGGSGRLTEGGGGGGGGEVKEVGRSTFSGFSVLTGETREMRGAGEVGLVVIRREEEEDPGRGGGGGGIGRVGWERGSEGGEAV